MAIPPSIPPFPAHARSVIRTVRGAFSETLSSLGADPSDPQSLGRALGLNRNLAWKISKIIQSDNLSSAIQQMPGAAGIRIFLDRIERAGANPALLQAAKKAVEEYDRLIEVHSGDRATLEMMASELSSAGRRQRDEYHRKLLYQGASYVWGAQAGAIVKVGAVAPGNERGRADFGSIGGIIDFRRIRQDVSWVVARRTSTNDDGSGMVPGPTEAIDTRYADPEQAPLMADFCSQPLPEIRRIAGPIGSKFELVEGPVGNTGARTCVFGTVLRGVPYYRTESNAVGRHAAVCDMPAKLMIVDLFIHESFAFAIPPEVILDGSVAMSQPASGGDQSRLPLNEPLQDLGTGSLPLATPEVPRYNPMVQAMFDHSGWDPTEFHGFRMKIPYPAFPTALILYYELPTPPES